MNCESFTTLLPAAGSVTTKEGAQRLLAQWLAEGPLPALFETACALGQKEFGPARSYLLGL